MTLPSKPVRKGPSVNVSPNGTKMSKGIPMPVRRSAAAFGSVDKSVYKHPTAPITPTSSPVNDKDSGKGAGNVR